MFFNVTSKKKKENKLHNLTDNNRPNISRYNKYIYPLLFLQPVRDYNPEVNF